MEKGRLMKLLMTMNSLLHWVWLFTTNYATVEGLQPYQEVLPLKRHGSLCRAFRPVRTSGTNEQIEVRGTREVRRDSLQHWVWGGYQGSLRLKTTLNRQFRASHGQESKQKPGSSSSLWVNNVRQGCHRNLKPDLPESPK